MIVSPAWMPALAALPDDACTTSTPRSTSCRGSTQVLAACKFIGQKCKRGGAHLHKQAAVGVLRLTQLQSRGLVHLNLHGQTPVSPVRR